MTAPAGAVAPAEWSADPGVWMDAIHPDDSQGETPLLPVLNRYKPTGGTGGVDFLTKRPITTVTRSHVNAVVQHSEWEAEAAKVLDASPHVAFFVRNDVAPQMPAIDVARGYRAPLNITRAKDVFEKIEKAQLPLVTVTASGVEA